MHYITIKEANDRLRRHKLLPKTLRKQVPRYSPDVVSQDDLVARVKFFAPDRPCYWYVVEANGDELGGLVFDQNVEYVGFFLSELETIRGPLGLPVERDFDFKPKTLKEIKHEHQQHEVEIKRKYLA